MVKMNEYCALTWTRVIDDIIVTKIHSKNGYKIEEIKLNKCVNGRKKFGIRGKSR